MSGEAKWQGKEEEIMGKAYSVVVLSGREQIGEGYVIDDPCKANFVALPVLDTRLAG